MTSASTGRRQLGADPATTPPAHPARLAVRLATGALLAGLVALPFLLLLLLVEGKYEGLENVDRGVADGLNGWALQHAGVVHLLDTLAVVLAPNTFRAVVVAVAVWLWVHRARRLALWAVVTLAVGGVLGVVLKHVVARARPTFPDPVASASSYSFPSGHALNSMLGTAIVLLVVLPVLGPRWRAVAWAVGAFLVLLTGFDRIALGVHFLSDVLAGWFVALAVVVGSTVAFGAWGRLRSRGLDPAESRRAVPGSP
ncbi:MAG: phosphatase PAP2 family protein [Motilibacteraceae bacterium]